MKKAALLFLFVMLAAEAYSQGAYYDAVRLRRNINSETGVIMPETPEESAVVKGIFDRYQYNRASNTNPFLDPLISTGGASALEQMRGTYGTPLTHSGSTGLSVTTVADGMARFLVKRMKEEMTVMFFESFERTLEGQRDLQLLFPATYSILLSAKQEIYNYQRYLPALQRAFEYDLHEFVSNAYRWSDSAEKTKLLTALQSNPKAYSLVKLTLFIAHELQQGTHPGELLATLAQTHRSELAAIAQDMPALVETASFISQSIRSNEPGAYWISVDEAAAFRDPVLVQLFVGLLYQTCPTVTFNSGGKTLKQILASQSDLLPLAEVIRGMVRDMAEAGEAIRESVRNLDPSKPSNYFRVARAVLTPMEKLAASGLLVTIPAGDLKEIRFYADHGEFLFAHVESGAYHAAVYEAFAILNHAATKPDGTNDGSAILNGLLKYGTFMASVITAESSAEVADAIEAAVLPPGSARIKREAAWNISLNAYLGGFYGNETITINGANQTGAVAGVWAPIGLAVSRSVRVGTTNWSLSAYGTFVDLGALASYRLDTENDQVETLPEIKFENIFSPGLYFIVGLPRVPISVGYGYQLTPQLREVTSTTTVLGPQANRYSLFVAVDIPLANFWTRTRLK